MKLRLDKNSVRLRLQRSEVHRLRETGCISQTIDFGIRGSDKLTYSLQSSSVSSVMFVRFANHGLEILLPHEMVEAWADTDMIGLYGEQKNNCTTRLKIIIEKDLALDRPNDAK